LILQIFDANLTCADKKRPTSDIFCSCAVGEVYVKRYAQQKLECGHM
jgi:hypothetical protein